MTNLQDLAARSNEIDAHDIALAAFHDDIVDDYEAIPFENGYRLMHPTNEALSLVFDLETDDDNQIDGWTYSDYERDEYGEWELIGTDGRGLDAGQPLADLLESIENTLTEWAK